MLPRTAAIVIIGAGVIGASIAYHLSRENIRAIVLEKKEVAGGSSGACEGLLLMQSKKPGLHSDLALQSLQRFSTQARNIVRVLPAIKNLKVIRSFAGLRP